MILHLLRDLASPQCTLGTITIGSLTVQTLERPWIPAPSGLCGVPNFSCVPAGTYQLARHDTPKHPKTWALVNPELGIYHEEIPAGCIGRNACLLHPGNWAEQLEGCIAPGMTRSQMGGQWMVGESVKAFEAIQALVPWVDGHILIIEYAPGVTP